MWMRIRTAGAIWLAVAAFGLPTARAQEAPTSKRFTGPWDVPALFANPPAATWGEAKGGVREVFYEGELLDGKSTRVFAYYARPESGDGPFPAMLLVHGGGGKAFREWAELWAKRGYVALAMDLAGHGPDGARLPDGGPEQDDHGKFRDFDDEEVRQMWTYHAVAAVLRGHALLAAREEVDRDRIGVTGISWGGYLTCIVAGIDDRLKVAVPVYGCGFLHEDSAWITRFEKMSPEQRDRWVANFDPSRYLPGVRAPILFVNGTNDFAYPLGSYRKSYRLVRGPRTLSVQVRMPHGHPQGWAPKEIGLFVDSVLKGGEPLPRLGDLSIAGGQASATIDSGVPIASAQLHYTTDTGPWQKRDWKSLDAQVSDGKIKSELPEGSRLAVYLTATDARGAVVSTEHKEVPGGEE
jgi:dienelactone hydrolase